MGDKGSGKRKLLLIESYLFSHSDENHPVSTEELMQMLSEQSITCERKSIYSDVQTLRDCGRNILRVKAPSNGYCQTSRTFAAVELRLLMDAVQAASFISADKTEELISKISTLCSTYQAEALRSQIGGSNKNKYANEEVYDSIGVIHQAIAAGKKIRFRYCKRVLDNKLKGVKLTEKVFVVSPYALIWSDDKYYLVSNNEKYDNLMHTRIDRMKRVQLLSRSARPAAEVSPYQNGFDAADYAAKTFNMFSGEMEPLELRCHSALLEEILDRFGTQITLTKAPHDDFFTVDTEGIISDGLVSWLMQFSSRIEVIAPVSLRAKLKKRSADILKMYENDAPLPNEDAN